ncbi:MAG: hypothetical protein LUI87_03730 [Lachnospiraceae bacterium]|nr:hypothetical protein [Lachnospiraceae bacterium]
MEDKLSFIVNGEKYTFGGNGSDRIPDTETLRETLHGRIPGIDLKKNCNRGICGNCTVLLDGRAVEACMILSASCQGAEIVTWEGLSDHEHRLYEIFRDSDYFNRHAAYISIRALVMVCIAQFRKKEEPSERDLMNALAGNYGSCLDIEKVMGLVRQYRDLEHAGCAEPETEGKDEII